MFTSIFFTLLIEFLFQDFEDDDDDDEDQQKMITANTDDLGSIQLDQQEQEEDDEEMDEIVINKNNYDEKFDLEKDKETYVQQNIHPLN